MKTGKALVMGAAILLVAGSAFAANTLTVTGGAALNGTSFGMSVNLDGTGNNVFVESQHPNNETHYRARFFLCPGGLNLNPNSSVRIGAIGDDTLGQHIVMFLRRDVPGGGTDQWLFNTWISASDAAPATYVFGTSTFLALNAAGAESCATNSAAHRWFEVEYTAGTGADGQLAVRRLVYNGSVLVEKFVNGRNTDTLQVDNARFGALAGSGASAASASSYFFDEFESYR